MLVASLWRGTKGRAPLILLIGSTVSAAAFLNHHNNHHAKQRPRRIMISSPSTTTLCEALPLNETMDNVVDIVVDDNTKWELMTVPHRGKVSSHIIFGTLLQQDNDDDNSANNLIERYDVYRSIIDETTPVRRVRGIVQLGGNLNGHPGVVHGGVLALLIDDVLGFGFAAIGVSMAMTANLNLNYLAPVPANTQIIIDAHLDRQEGRKLYWTVLVTDATDPSRIYCNATSLYIIPRHAYTTTK